MKPKSVIGWILSILSALIFLFAAYLQLTGNPIEVQGFGLFGLPLWFMYIVGATEVIGSGLLLSPKQPLAGAALLSLIGLGAAYEHLSHGQLGFAPIPLVVSALAVGGAILRDGLRAFLH